MQNALPPARVVGMEKLTRMPPVRRATAATIVAPSASLPAPSPRRPRREVALLVETSNGYARGLLKGTADHGVSRSLYTADPDGNEIELYCDSPREEWEGRVDQAMTVRPLGFD